MNKQHNLFEAIKNATDNGYKVSIHTEGFNLIASVENVDDPTLRRESWLPTADHFTEDTVSRAIEFMRSALNEQFCSKSKSTT